MTCTRGGRSEQGRPFCPRTRIPDEASAFAFRPPHQPSPPTLCQRRRRRWTRCDAVGAIACGKGARQATDRVARYRIRPRHRRNPGQFHRPRRTAITANGSLPAPTLRWREGDTVTLRVANNLREDTSLHWHGILLPADMDGVPGLSFHGIHPGETFVVPLPACARRHLLVPRHSSLQEAGGRVRGDRGRSAEADPVAVDRDYVVVLSDWSDEDPHRHRAQPQESRPTTTTCTSAPSVTCCATRAGRLERCARRSQGMGRGCG